MSKALSMSGSPLGETAAPAGAAQPATTDPAKVASVFGGFNWKHVLAVVGGSFALAGGGTLAYLGWTRDRKVWKWGGLALAGTGLITIVVACIMAYTRSKALGAAIMGRGDYDQYVDPNRVAERGDVVALVDGRMARVNALTTSLDGSHSFDLRMIENGAQTQEQLWVKDQQLAGVVVARG